MKISDPTPVTSSAKRIDSWSTSRAAFRSRLPTLIQSNIGTCTARWSTGAPSIWIHSTAVTTNEPNAPSTPSQWPQASVALPPSSRIADTTRGIAIISQA